MKWIKVQLLLRAARVTCKTSQRAGESVWKHYHIYRHKVSCCLGVAFIYFQSHNRVQKAVSNAFQNLSAFVVGCEGEG